jgi:hypothetical protein
MNLNKIILEVLDTVLNDYEIKVHSYSNNVTVYFSLDNEKYEINFNRDVEIDELVTVDFQRWGGEDDGWNMSSPKSGDYNPSKIIGAIFNLIKIVLQKFPNIHFLTFNTNKDNKSRVRLYDALVKRAISSGVVKQADTSTPMYKDIKYNYPASWVLEVVR